MKVATLALGCLIYLMLGYNVFAEENVTIEVLIYSGRPNPTWEVTDTNELQAIERQLGGELEITEEPAEWSRLGFQGFSVRGLKVPGFPGKIRVFKGVIGVQTGKQIKYLKDKNGIEQRLIKLAQKQQLADHVKDAIAKHEKAMSQQSAEPEKGGK